MFICRRLQKRRAPSHAWELRVLQPSPPLSPPPLSLSLSLFPPSRIGFARPTPSFGRVHFARPAPHSPTGNRFIPRPRRPEAAEAEGTAEPAPGAAASEACARGALEERSWEGHDSFCRNEDFFKNTQNVNLVLRESSPSTC